MFRRKRVMSPEAVEAMEIAARISKKSDEIMARLFVYQQMKDPFMSLMSDIYTSGQVQKIYHGPNGVRPR